ncbi:hypothetical protein DFH07DRAFT_323503 [Mycena maculata]|uniref:Uncharacterized protein n=1 Tax=Mycena maculata TaxID=230809 RepID=A0AAD7NZS3_9AGAR|nr:hypothetical protein DFH07DRAFT_323503 [Mycena maculata]
MWKHTRLGTCPLSISLESGLDYSTNRQPASDLFLQVLISFSSRWCCIAFTISVAIMKSLSHLTENDVPMLQDIMIVRENPVPLGAVHPIPNTRQRAAFGIFRGPKISSFYVSRPGFGRMAELPLRWSQLTALSLLFYEDNSVLTGLTSKRALEILSRCPQLRMCSLSIYDDNSTQL